MFSESFLVHLNDSKSSMPESFGLLVATMRMMRSNTIYSQHRLVRGCFDHLPRRRAGTRRRISQGMFQIVSFNVYSMKQTIGVVNGECLRKNSELFLDEIFRN